MIPSASQTVTEAGNSLIQACSLLMIYSLTKCGISPGTSKEISTNPAGKSLTQLAGS
jgi:hypothetical protein